MSKAQTYQEKAEQKIKTLQSALSVNNNVHKENVRKLPSVGQRY